MANSELNQVFKEANQCWELLQSEMFKSKEDLVPFTICSLARNCSKKFMQAFLIKNGVSTTESWSPAQLLEKCILIEPGFKSLSLDEMYCKTEEHDSSFCTSFSHLESCFHMAKKIKETVEMDHWPISARFK